MKKLLRILTLALSMLMLVSCGGDGGQNTPPTPENKPEDKEVNYILLVRPDASVDLSGIVSAIYDNNGRMMSIVLDENTQVDGGEIVFGDADRTVSVKAKALLDANIAAEGGAADEFGGYLIYKDDATGNIAVVWSDSHMKTLAIESFLDEYSNVELLKTMVAGTIKSEIVNIDEYVYSTRWAKLEAEAPADVYAALKHLADNYYRASDLMDWAANLWEPYFCACGNCAAEGKEIACYGGAFYYANSARDNQGFYPDIESTGFILSLLAYFGAFDEYGGWVNAIKEVPGMTESLIKFVQSLQDEATGYFYHPQWGSNIGSSRRGRDLNRAISLLKSLGAEPLYPTAIDRLNGSGATSASLTRPLGNSAAVAVSAVVATADFESAIKSEEAYMKWLVEVTNGDNMIKNSAGAHTLNSVASQIHAAGYTDITLDYLDSMAKKCYDQMKAAYDADPVNNPEPTGVWQTTVDYDAVWGLIKLYTFYDRGNRSYLYHEEALRTCIKVIMFDPEVGGNYHMNDMMNQWAGLYTVITNAKAHKPEIVSKLYAMANENAAAMIKQTEGKLAKFIQADGSYGYNQGTSAPTTQGVLVSLGLPEGDSNAVEMAKNLYNYIFLSLGYERVKLCDYRDGERILETLRNSQPVTKNPVRNNDPYSFDDMPLGMSQSMASGGSAEIAADPANAENSVLKFVTYGTAGDYVTFTPYGNPTSSNCFIFSADLYAENANRELLYQITLGNSYMVEILYRNGKIMVRDNPTTSNSNNANLYSATVDLKTWFSLRIEYYVDATNPTVKLYLDDTLIAISHNYYGSHNTGATPKNGYSNLKIYSLIKTDATLLIDNVYVSAENKEYIEESIGSKLAK